MNKVNSYKYSKSLIALGIVIINVNLGSVFNIFGLNLLSWFLAILLFFIFLSEKNYKIRFVNTSMKNWFYFFIFWLFYGILQIILIKDFYLATKFYLILFINMFLCCFIIMLIKTDMDLRLILNFFSASFIVNILAGYWEFLTGKHIISLGARNIEGYIGKVGGFIGNFNDFCTFLFIAIVIFLIQVSITNSLAKRIIYVAGIATSIHLIYINGARGGIYAVWLLLLTIPFYFYNRNIKRTKYQFLVIFIVASVFFFGVFFLVTNYSMYRFIAILGTTGDYRSDLIRVQLIKDGIKALINSAGLGIGAGQSILLNGTNIHNFYIEILSEYGIVIGLGAIWISLIIPIKSDNHNSNFINALLQATAVSLIVANVTSSSSNKMRAMWIFLTILLIVKKTNILSYENVKKRNQSRKD